MQIEVTYQQQASMYRCLNVNPMFGFEMYNAVNCTLCTLINAHQTKPHSIADVFVVVVVVVLIGRLDNCFGGIWWCLILKSSYFDNEPFQ